MPTAVGTDGSSVKITRPWHKEVDPNDDFFQDKCDCARKERFAQVDSKSEKGGKGKEADAEDNVDEKETIDKETLKDT